MPEHDEHIDPKSIESRLSGEPNRRPIPVDDQPGEFRQQVESIARVEDDPHRFFRGEMDPVLSAAEIADLHSVVRTYADPVKVTALYGAKAGSWDEGRWHSTCPLCQGPEGSFQAGEDGVWGCGFCKEGGDVADLVAKAEGWTTDQATLQLAQWQDLVAQWQAPMNSKEWFQRMYERKAAREQWQKPNPTWEPPHRLNN